MRRPTSYLEKLCLAVCVGMLIHSASSAQCANNMATKSYDTTLSNTGFAIYSLNLPQFSPDSGQLVSVRLTATVNSTYAFTLTNNNPSSASYQLDIGQEDQFSAAYGTPWLNITPMHVGNYTLNSGQAVTMAPFPFMTNHVSTDSITGNVAPFLGHGQVNINYMSFAYTNIWAFDHASYTFDNALTSTTQLSMQYLYCKAGVILATDLTRWSAKLTAPTTVQLDWSVVNEAAGRQYEIQRSVDGHNFTTIGIIATTMNSSAADHTYNDILPDGTTGVYYYRLQIRDKDETTWSRVRQVSLEAATKGLQVYPNPATDHIDIATGTANSDWQVDILSASGGIVQHETFLQSNLLHIGFNNHLATGTYFARITDLRGQKMLVSSFVVH